MKKHFIIWIAMVAALIALPVTAWASPAPESDFEFDADIGMITKYTGTASEVEIPDSIGGIAVEDIGGRAFEGCENLVKITIPESVTCIGGGAFSGCGSLTEITIPSDVTVIGDFTFEKCSSLAKITLPESVTSIGDYAFSECGSLTEITLPESVTSIGNSAFSGCGSLVEITILSGVTVIDSFTFEKCSKLAKITLPESVTGIGDYAFSGCGSLAEITLPQSVTSIGDSAFFECVSLAEVTLPESMISIGASAFSGCVSLAKVTLPQSVTSIGDSAFFGCGSLAKVTLPQSVTSIGDSAFFGCGSLAEITLPQSVTSIGDSAFFACSGLASIKVDPKNSVFDSRDNCNAIIVTENNALVVGCKTTKIPESVTSISEYAFFGCKGLTEITIPESVTNIGEDAFTGCDANLILYVRVNSYAETYAINNGFRYASKSADGTIEQIQITNIVLDQTVVNLKKGDTVLLRASVIPAQAASQPLKWSSSNAGVASVVNGLVTANKEGTAEIRVEAQKDNEISAICMVHVAQEAHSPGGNVNPPENNPAGSGNAMQFPADNLPAKGKKMTDTKTKATYVVTEPGAAVAYAGTTNKKAVSLSIPATVKIEDTIYKVTSVAKNALKNNKKVQKVTVSGNAASIGVGAFQGCTALKTVKMGSKVTTIGDKAFYGCKKLSALTIGKNVSVVGGSAFQNCTALKKITVPAKVKKIGSKAFSGCKNLTGIIVKSRNLTEKNVGGKAFAGAGSSNYKKMKVAVPAKKYAAYKKLLKKKGLSGKAEIVKK